MYRQNKQIGKLDVSTEIVESGGIGSILALMEFTPLHVEYCSFLGKYKYTGISFMFEEVREIELIPKYKILIHVPKDGKKL